MKNTILGLMLAVILALAFTGCGNSTPSENSAVQAKSEKVEYTCPMHPEIIRDEPGNCPKCGMTLVEKKEMPQDTMHNMSADSMENMKNQ